MAHVTLLVGSMMGATEYVADRLSELLNEHQHQTEIVLDFDNWQPHTEPDEIWLICTSTHGAGDLPDNIQPLADWLASHQPDLSQVKYGVVGVGDTSYDTFCQGSKTLDTLFSQLGASRIGERLEIDVMEYPVPEEEAERWLPEWLSKL